MKLDELGRVIGSALVIIGYFIVLHVNTKLGAGIHLTADLISVPFFIRTRAWDIVIMVGFLTTISMSKLLA
jgi:hypothetical protein